MRNIVYRVLYLLIFIFQLSTISGSEELIETCPSPWVTYNTKTSPFECEIRCEGKAFHTKEGNLICFNEMGSSRPKPQLGRKTSARLSKILTCECGYFIPRMSSKWLPCENHNILETTIDICLDICKRMTVYVYKRSRVRTILLCENEERNEFYDMVGQNGRVIKSANTRFVKYRECSCGIASTELKPILRTMEKSTNSAVSFLQCSKPWETLYLWEITKLETCEYHCQRVCTRGSGIIYKKEAFCFMRHSPAKKRSPFQGAVKGTCECGYVKNIKSANPYKKKYIPCNPPITRAGLLGQKCHQFCAESTAYIYQKVREQLTVRCIYKPAMKPEPLVPKCDKRIFQKESHNVTKKYSKCSCGLEKSLDGEIVKKHAELDNNVEITLPNSWVVKKKRSAVRSNRKDNKTAVIIPN